MGTPESEWMRKSMCTTTLVQYTVSGGLSSGLLKIEKPQILPSPPRVERVPHFLLDTGGCIRARLQPCRPKANRMPALAAAAGGQGLKPRPKTRLPSARLKPCPDTRSFATRCVVATSCPPPCPAGDMGKAEPEGEGSGLAPLWLWLCCSGTLSALHSLTVSCQPLISGYKLDRYAPRNENFVLVVAPAFSPARADPAKRGRRYGMSRAKVLAS